MSKNVFKKNPNLKEYHETSDGVKFYTKHDAANHARSLKDKKVNHVTAGDLNAVEKPVKKSAEERIEFINSLETVEDVEAALKDESAKTVKAAGAEKIEELSK